MNRINRRKFLTTAGIIGLFPSIPIHAATPKPTPTKNRLPSRIIFIVADGMGMGALTCGDLFSKLTRKRPLTWIQKMNQPGCITGLMNVRSLNSIVTDSAAASSAWGCGSRVNNGSLNVLPDGRNLMPLVPLFKKASWKTGLVTTTTVTHATPAGFVVNAADRNSEHDVAAQYAAIRPDVVLGGGQDFFLTEKRPDKKDILAQFKAARHAIVFNSKELESVQQGNVLGLFEPSHLSYTIDRIRDPKGTAGVPTLRQMTEKALQLMGNSSFLLQVEGGRVDHAGHATDAAALVHEMIAFDEAIEACLDYQNKFPETLIVITADHATGNVGVNGLDKAYSGSSTSFSKLARFKGSLGFLLKEIGADTKAPQVNDMIQALGDHTGISVSARDAEEYRALCEAAYAFKPITQVGFNQQFASPLNALGQLLSTYTGMAWTGNSHTSDHVILSAMGPGSEKFGGFIQNTDVFKHLTALAKIDHTNPMSQMTDDIG